MPHALEILQVGADRIERVLPEYADTMTAPESHSFVFSGIMGGKAVPMLSPAWEVVNLPVGGSFMGFTNLVVGVTEPPSSMQPIKLSTAHIQL